MYTCGWAYVCASLVLWTCLAGSAFSDSEVFALVGGTNGRSVYRSVSGARTPHKEPHKGPDGRDTRLVLSARIATRAFSVTVTGARAIPDVCALPSSSQFQINIWADDRNSDIFPPKCAKMFAQVFNVESDLFYHIALVYNCKISAHTRTLKWFIYHETRFDYFSWNITQFVLSVERVWLYKYTIHRNLTQSISLGNIFAFFNIAPTARREYVSWFSIELRLRKNHSTSWHNYYHEKCVQTND